MRAPPLPWMGLALLPSPLPVARKAGRRGQPARRCRRCRRAQCGDTGAHCGVSRGRTAGRKRKKKQTNRKKKAKAGHSRPPPPPPPPAYAQQTNPPQVETRPGSLPTIALIHIHTHSSIPYPISARPPRTRPTPSLLSSPLLSSPPLSSLSPGSASPAPACTLKPSSFLLACHLLNDGRVRLRSPTPFVTCRGQRPAWFRKGGSSQVSQASQPVQHL